jgi:hypothetical protein
VEIPEGWQYGVIRKDDSPYEEHVMRGPNGEERRISVNGMDFWRDPQDYLNGIRNWVETGGTNDTTA